MDVDVESDVADLYQQCGFNLCQPPQWWRFGEVLFGPDFLDFCSRREMGGKAELSERLVQMSVPWDCVDPSHYIRMWARLPAIEQGFYACHESIEWLKARQGYMRQDVEQHCNRAAAGCLMPGPALTTAMHHIEAIEQQQLAMGVPPDKLINRFERLARRFQTTQYCAALRFGEWFDTPIILYRKMREPELRGRPFPWGGDKIIRWMGRTNYVRPGTRRVIFDQPEPGQAIWLDDETKYDLTPRLPPVV